MATAGAERSEYDEIISRLTLEAEGVHAPATVARCVTAAAEAAHAITGHAPPDLVESVARKHLEVLSLTEARS